MKINCWQILWDDKFVEGLSSRSIGKIREFGSSWRRNYWRRSVSEKFGTYRDRRGLKIIWERVMSEAKIGFKIELKIVYSSLFLLFAFNKVSVNLIYVPQLRDHLPNPILSIIYFYLPFQLVFYLVVIWDFRSFRRNDLRRPEYLNWESTYGQAEDPGSNPGPGTHPIGRIFFPL